MNLPTWLIAVAFFVVLGAIVVAQRLEIRSASYRVGQSEKQLLINAEQIRVLKTKKAQAEDPRRLRELVEKHGIPLVPPEFKPEPEKPGKKKS